MRQEIDKRILGMRQEKLNQVLGFQFIKRLRYYIKALQKFDDLDTFS